MHARARDGGWHGEEERDHSADERRADGANGICPTKRAMAPAIATTMIGPITPDLLWSALRPTVTPTKKGSA